MITKFNHIIKASIKLSKVPLLIWLILCLFLKKHTWLAGTLLGLSGSLLTTKILISAQIDILKTKQKKHVFLPFCFRLITTGTPICIALVNKNYFNFPITLLFLFFFQAMLIVLEIIRSKKSFNKKKKRWIK